MANFKRLSLFLSPLLLFCVGSAEAKLTPAQFNQAHKEYERALYSSVLKIISPANETDFSASVLDAKVHESYDSGVAVGDYERSGHLTTNASVRSMCFAYAIFLTRKYERALAEFKNAVKADPANAEAHADLGLCLFYLDQSEQGIAEIKKAQALDAKFVVDEYFARAYVAAGESKKAEPYFNKIVARNPGSARLHIMRGDFFVEAGKSAQALADYDAAIQLSPTSAYAHFRKAKLLTEMQKYQEVIPEAIKGSSPESIEEFGIKSTRLLANAYEHLQQYQKAIDIMKPKLAYAAHVAIKSAQVPGTDRIALLQLSDDYEKLHDYKNAKAAVDIMLRVDPKSTESYSRRARIFAELNDPINALKDYAYLINADPTNPQWFSDRAKVYQKLGKTTAAAADLKKAKDLE